MSLQEILFVAGVALLALGGILVALATYLFVARNIPDIRDDLSGKKRATAIAQMSNEQVASRRRTVGKGKGAAKAAGNTTSAAAVTGQVGAPAPTTRQQATTSRQVAPATGGRRRASASSKGGGGAKPAAVATKTPTPQMATTDTSGEGTTIIAESAMDTTILSDEPGTAKAQGEVEGSGTRAASDVTGVTAAPTTFHIARKIVLTGSTEIVGVGQGDSDA